MYIGRVDFKHAGIHSHRFRKAVLVSVPRSGQADKSTTHPHCSCFRAMCRRPLTGTRCPCSANKTGLMAPAVSLSAALESPLLAGQAAPVSSLSRCTKLHSSGPLQWHACVLFAIACASASGLAYIIQPAGREQAGSDCTDSRPTLPPVCRAAPGWTHGCGMRLGCEETPELRSNQSQPP